MLLARTGAGVETKTLLDILLEARQTDPQFDEKQIHDEMLNVIVTVGLSSSSSSYVRLARLRIRNQNVLAFGPDYLRPGPATCPFPVWCRISPPPPPSLPHKSNK